MRIAINAAPNIYLDKLFFIKTFNLQYYVIDVYNQLIDYVQLSFMVKYELMDKNI